MPAVEETVEQVRRIDVDQYKYGFVTDIESEKAPKGLSEDTVRYISAKKGEPARTSFTIRRPSSSRRRSRSTRSIRKSSRLTRSWASR
jgi:hypothetical protein